MRKYLFSGLIFLLISSCRKEHEEGSYSYKEMFSTLDKMEDFSGFKESIGIGSNEKMEDFQFKRKLKVMHIKNVHASKHEKLEDLLVPDNEMYDLDLFHNPKSGNSIVLKIQGGSFVELGASVPNSEGVTKKCGIIPLIELDNLENRNQAKALREVNFADLVLSFNYSKKTYIHNDDLRKALVGAAFPKVLFSCTNCMVVHANNRSYFQVDENKWSEFEIKQKNIPPDYLKEKAGGVSFIDSLFVTYDNDSLYGKIMNKPDTTTSAFYAIPFDLSYLVGSFKTDSGSKD